MRFRGFMGHCAPGQRDKQEGIKTGNEGFTLLELSIVLTIIALVTGMSVEMGIATITTARQAATIQKMKAIDQALMAFRTANNRLPCPGDLTITQGSANFGVEAGGSNVCTTGTGVCTGSTLAGTCIGTAVSPAANYSAAGATYTNETGAEGALPVVTLGLSNDFMVDGWGFRFRYAVDTTMTELGAFHDSPVNNTCGAITVNDVNGNARATDAIYALISHGANGHGAYTQAGGTVNAGSVNANELINCHCSSATGADNGSYAATYVQEQSPTLDPTNSLDTYDDLVTYKERWQMQTAWDPVMTMYIADPANYVIRKVQGCIITTVAGNYALGYGYSGDGGPATSAGLSNVPSVAVDSSGNLYLADTGNQRIRKVTAATGIITTVAGNGTQGYSGDGGLATSAKLQMPWSVAVDRSGNIYIADFFNARIRKVTAATGIITTVAGNGSITITNASGVPATSVGIGNPQAVALDAAGNLYFTDNTYSVRKVTVATGIITTAAGTIGSNGYTGDGGPATSATLIWPAGVALDSSGNIYIADIGNDVIRKVTASTGIITTVAGSSWAFGYRGDGGPATSASLSLSGGAGFGSGVSVDSAGNIYIADTNNYVIRKVTASTGIIRTVAGNNAGNNALGYSFSGNGGPATNAGFYPSQVAVTSGAAVSNR